MTRGVPGRLRGLRWPAPVYWRVEQAMSERGSTFTDTVVRLVVWALDERDRQRRKGKMGDG